MRFWLCTVTYIGKVASKQSQNDAFSSKLMKDKIMLKEKLKQLGENNNIIITMIAKNNFIEIENKRLQNDYIQKNQVSQFVASHQGNTGKHYK